MVVAIFYSVSTEVAQLIGALEQPVPTSMRDQGGKDHGRRPFRRNKAEEQIEPRHQNQKNGKLAEFDADIERKQRAQDVRARELQRFAECERKAEAVDQSERESHHPPAAPAG